MKDSDSYWTISALAQAKIESKGSRFLALARPVSSEAEIKIYLKQLQKEFSAATHLCYAYRLGVGNDELSKAFDAGEPNFTAGKPILNAIVSHRLANIMVAVVRWFGGTKLGKANLARAYRQAAEEALKRAEKIEKLITAQLVFRCQPERFDLIQTLLLKYKAEILNKNFNSNCQIVAAVPRMNLAVVKERLTELTSGQIAFE
jgi:uncharacterized YigZ family protein